MPHPQPIHELEQRVYDKWQVQKSTVMSIFGIPDQDWQQVCRRDPLLAKMVLPYMMDLAPMTSQARLAISTMHETYQELKAKSLHEPTYDFGPELRTIAVLESVQGSAPLIPMSDLTDIAFLRQSRKFNSVYVDIFSYIETLFAQMGLDPYDLFSEEPECANLHAKITQYCSDNYAWPLAVAQAPMHIGASDIQQCKINALTFLMKNRLTTRYHDRYTDFLIQEVLPEVANGTTHPLYPEYEPFQVHDQHITPTELIEWASMDKASFIQKGIDKGVPPAPLRYGIRGPLFDLVTADQYVSYQYEDIAQYVMEALRRYAFYLTTKLVFNQLKQSFNLENLPEIRCEFAW